MSAQNDTYAIGGTMLSMSPLGASVFPTLIQSPPAGGQFYINALATGATVQILPTSVAGASIGGATAVGASVTGYPVGPSQVISWVGPASFYLACTGSTAQIAMLLEYTAGATLA
jgi:hypothetical protein